MRSLIEAGRIKRNKGSPQQEEVSYVMRFMDDSNLLEVMDLQGIIIQNLSDKEIFRTHSIDYFIDHFTVENAVIGIFTEDGLIAYNILYFPGENEDNFGADVNLPRDELDRVAHLQRLPSGLQRQLLQSKMVCLLEVIQEWLSMSAAWSAQELSQPSKYTHGLIMCSEDCPMEAEIYYA
jgi:hypothetical protein